MTILDGKSLAKKVKEDIKLTILEKFSSKNILPPKLAIIMVGEEPASLVYVKQKLKSCSYVGIQTEIFDFKKDVDEETLCKKIDELNKDYSVNGIIVQLPLPKNLDARKVINSISVKKDVDGLSENNLGKLLSGSQEGFAGCTASGVIALLKENKIDLTGKDVVIINRSLLVGKPLLAMFLNENATVTVCHSRTKNLKEKTLCADIVVVGVGKGNFLKSDMIKTGAVVVDVGINRSKTSNSVQGDVDFDQISRKASYITPVPGGVGPMTVAMLLKNTLDAAIKQNETWQ